MRDFITVDKNLVLGEIMPTVEIGKTYRATQDIIGNGLRTVTDIKMYRDPFSKGEKVQTVFYKLDGVYSNNKPLSTFIDHSAFPAIEDEADDRPKAYFVRDVHNEIRNGQLFELVPPYEYQGISYNHAVSCEIRDKQFPCLDIRLTNNSDNIYPIYPFEKYTSKETFSALQELGYEVVSPYTSDEFVDTDSKESGWYFDYRLRRMKWKKSV